MTKRATPYMFCYYKLYQRKQLWTTLQIDFTTWMVGYHLHG
jgi:hypothetical protein